MRTKRLTKEARTEQLLTILNEVYAEAKTQADFTGQTIAQRAGVSDTIVYRLIGDDIGKLRKNLPGSAQKREAVVGELRTENRGLRQQLREEQAGQREVAKADIDAALLLIERLDEENRALRGENALMRKRLREGAGVVVMPPQQGNRARGFAVVDGGRGAGQASLFPIDKDDRNA